MAIMKVRLLSAAFILLSLFGRSEAQTTINSGRSLLDIGSPAGGSYQFINFLKSCGGLRSTKYAFPAILNVNGYPQSPPSEDVSCRFRIPTLYEGNWVIRWTGQFGKGADSGVRLAGAAFTVQQGGQFSAASSRGLRAYGHQRLCLV